ncbi:MAG: DUF6660 family protein [Bacteroidota bacterium]
MKRLAILLPVYLIILSCMPCKDGEDGMDSTQPVITKGLQGHDKDSETCSPFCSCNCCGQQRASQQKSTSVSNLFIITPVVKMALVQPFSLQNVLQQIWQPPQLV